MMKSALTILCLCCSLLSHAGGATFDKLNEINTSWSQQWSGGSHDLPVYRHLSEREWIRLHLSLVERILRNREVKYLSDDQKKLRRQSLDDLHQYWMTGNFPVNDDYASRTPIFIDKYDNFCAVGYLIKASGREDISRLIASRTNLAYVMDMKYPQLKAWAGRHGFTQEELAWIQPSYPPAHYTASVGRGVNGEVMALFVDKTGDRLYVGGHFTEVDSSVAAANIAYVTMPEEGVFTWHNMGAGVNGPVHAIAEWDNKIFAAGSFGIAGSVAVNNIAYWNGTEWNHAGCIHGTVNDLVVFNNELYAAGIFDVCTSMTDLNFSRWDGTMWVQIPGLKGPVNTMEVMGDRLLLGGSFTYNDDSVHVMAWRPDSLFIPFDNKIANEVQDFQEFKDDMYAACRRTHTEDSISILMKLDRNEWKPVYTNPDTFTMTSCNQVLSLNTLLVDGSFLLAGGQFFDVVNMMRWTQSCTDVTPPPYPRGDQYFYTDSSIRKMTWFKQNMIAGGSFRSGLSPISSAIPLSGIARRVSVPTKIRGYETDIIFNIYPSPVPGNGLLTIENNIGAEVLLVRDLVGRQVFRAPLTEENKQQVRIPVKHDGLYIVEIYNGQGNRLIKKLQIR